MSWWRRKRRQRKGKVQEALALFSPEALQRAWQIVRRNGTTPGVDRVTVRRFERDLERNLAQLQGELASGAYEPLPVKRVLVPKPKGGLRPLAIWTLRDRVAQRVVHDYLVPIVEPRFLDCSYGFRPGRSVSDAVQAVVEARDAHRCWVVDADIEDCFGSLDRLSFGYTLLLKDVTAAVQVVGLDPYLGFFHALGYDRPALALDLMEEWRPVIVDSMFLDIVAKKRLLPDDFERTRNPRRPCSLGEAGVRVVIEQYEQRLQTPVAHALARGQTTYRRAIEL